jgi:hypothetical protein
VEALWPELIRLDEVDHTKELHPEGNGWNHTMETFRYRKPIIPKQPVYDFRLSLGLLLHDVGKPLAAATGKHPFDRHAEIGATVVLGHSATLHSYAKTPPQFVGPGNAAHFFIRAAKPSHTA